MVGRRQRLFVSFASQVSGHLTVLLSHIILSMHIILWLLLYYSFESSVNLLKNEYRIDCRPELRIYIYYIVYYYNMILSNLIILWIWPHPQSLQQLILSYYPWQKILFRKDYGFYIYLYLFYIYMRKITTMFIVDHVIYSFIYIFFIYLFQFHFIWIFCHYMNVVSCFQSCFNHNYYYYYYHIF